MAIALTGNTGLGNRMADVFNAVKAQQALQGTIGAGLSGPLASIAKNLLGGMAVVDSLANPQLPLVKVPTDTLSSLNLLIAQMIGTGSQGTPQYYIAKPTVSASIGAVSNPAGTLSNVYPGTWKLAASLIGPNGVQCDYAIPEVILGYVPSGSSSTNSVTLGSEPITLSSPAPTSTDPLDVSSPSYSGINVQINVTDPTVSGSQPGQNLLANSDFQSFTTNTATGWTYLVGSAGTSAGNIGGGTTPLPFANNTTGLTDTLNLTLFSDGATALSLAQPFGTGTGGNGVTLSPGVVYGVGLYSRVSSTGSVAGVVTVDLIDSTGSPQVVADDNGVDNSFTIDHSVLTATYALFTGFFRLPTVSAAKYVQPYQLRIRESTVFDTGKSVYVTGLAMTQAPQLYAGGPFVFAMRGKIDAATGDNAEITVANDWATNAKMGLMFNQVFGLTSLGLQIPSLTTATATMPESLIID